MSDSVLKFSNATNDEDEIPQISQFSLAYKTLSLFEACMELQSTKQYPQMRDLFYDTLQWYEPVFDKAYIMNCCSITRNYNQQLSREIYTYEQLAQLKYIRNLLEFSKLITRLSTQKHANMYQRPDKIIELAPVGFGKIFVYERMVTALFNSLSYVSKTGTQTEVIQFFNHSIGWFGGIMDYDFLVHGYKIINRDVPYRTQYRLLLGDFAKLISRHSITKLPLTTLIYKPQWEDKEIPHTIEDIVK